MPGLPDKQPHHAAILGAGQFYTDRPRALRTGFFQGVSNIDRISGAEHASIAPHASHAKEYTHAAEAQQTRSIFEDRLASFAEKTREKTGRLRPGKEKDDLLMSARQADTASHIDEGTSSPGLQPPK